MAENPQEKLENRIQRQEVITTVDVGHAYDEAFEERRNEYLKQGKDPAKFEENEKSWVESAQKLRDSQLQRLTALKIAKEKKKMKIEQESQRAERVEKSLVAWKYAEDITDPDKPKAPIDDYEGTGIEDKLGYGRSTLMGYLYGLRFHNPALSSQAFNNAKDAYNKTSGVFKDMHLSNAAVDEIVGKDYLGDIAKEGLDLGNATKGFLAAHLRLNDSYFRRQEEKVAYRNYLKDCLKKLGAAGKLVYNPPRGEDRFISDYKKSYIQTTALLELKSPQEWVANLKKRLEGFKKPCSAVLSANPEFHFRDRDVVELLATAGDNVAEFDENKIDTCTEKARKEILDHLGKKKEELKKNAKLYRERFVKLKDRNQKLKAPAISEDDGTALEKITAQQHRDAQNIFFNQNATLDQMESEWSNMNVVVNSGNIIAAKLDETEKKIAESEKKGKEAPKPVEKGGEPVPPAAPALAPAPTPAPEAPKKAPVEADPYKANWAKGERTTNPFADATGPLKVAPTIDSMNLRNENGDIVGKVPGGTELKLAEPRAEALKVGDLTFIRVVYKRKVYFAAREYLLKSETGAPPVPEKPGIPQGKEHPIYERMVDKHPENPLAFLGQVRSEYRDALERIWRDGEKPGGALFDIYFNKRVLPCRLQKMSPGLYTINWVGGALQYRSLKEAMYGINSGILLQQITFGALSTPDYYKPYEKSIDSFKEEVRQTGRPDQVYFELDWKGGGRGEGNAQVYAKANRFGTITYNIRRDHAGLNGESDRSGTAANFDDFMRQIAHIKTWAENFEDNAAEKKLTPAVMNREAFYSQITDPRNFSRHERAIGRLVSFGISNSEVVQMYLDWGGGGVRDPKHNPLLNVWAERDGRLYFHINYSGKNIFVQGTANSMQELVLHVSDLKRSLKMPH